VTVRIDRQRLHRIWEMRKEGLPMSIIAERLGVSLSAVRDVLGGKTSITRTQEKAPVISERGPAESCLPGNVSMR